MTVRSHRNSPSGPLQSRKVAFTATSSALTAPDTEDVAVAVTGVQTTDIVTLNPGTALTAGGGVVAVWVSDTDEVTVRLAAIGASGAMTATGDLEIRRYDV